MDVDPSASEQKHAGPPTSSAAGIAASRFVIPLGEDRHIPVELVVGMGGWKILTRSREQPVRMGHAARPVSLAPAGVWRRS
jgi:hypothetical protein